MNDVPMKRCIKCGEEKPATTTYFYAQGGENPGKRLKGACKECFRKGVKAYYEKNADTISLKMQEYYTEHAEERKAYDKQYRRTHYDEVIARQKAYRRSRKHRVVLSNL